MLTITRSKYNPILQPNTKESWEAQAVLNGCPVEKHGSIKLLYRAISLPHYHTGAQARMRISDIGIADSEEGIHFTNRRKFIVPDKQWDRFGCEDPRTTEIDGRYYTFYTALSDYPFTASGIRVAVAISDDLETITEKHLVTPFNAKAMALFPSMINGKYTVILTVHSDIPPAKIAIAQADHIEDFWDDLFWEKWYKTVDNNAISLRRFPEDHVEVGAVPLATKDGWLLIYSHISNYTDEVKRVFAIEASLLDWEDPRIIRARTAGPLLTPEASYELYGFIPNVIFPSGSRIDGDTLSIYYGAADHTVCVAETSLSLLIDMMKADPAHRIKFTRFSENPIITPKKANAWEEYATFNPTAFYEDGKVHIVYRAMGLNNTSVMGYATSKDGVTIDKRYEDPIYVPREEFEQKMGKSDGNSGCEDGRITRLGSRLYMCYTAYNGVSLPRVAFTSIKISDFTDHKWEMWTKPILISPPNFDNKDACLFPEKINGKYLFLHRMGEDIDLAYVDSLDFDGKTWLEEHRWLKPRKGTWDSAKIGIAGPPFKTDNGWVLLYHGVSDRDMAYRVGAVLLDIDDPTKILGRTDHPLLEPKQEYEKDGIVSNVVFPCGSVVIDDTVFLYYGGGDKVVGGATLSITNLLNSLY